MMNTGLNYFLTFFFILASTLMYGQDIPAEKIIYDIDGMIYEKIKDRDTTYFDKTGSERKPTRQINEKDIDLKFLGNFFESHFVIPQMYLDSNTGGGITHVNLSFIIEPSGEISNFRIINAYWQVRNYQPDNIVPLLRKEDIISGWPTFKKITPYCIEDKPVAVEVVHHMVIIAMISIRREKKSLGYKTD